MSVLPDISSPPAPPLTLRPATDADAEAVATLFNTEADHDNLPFRTSAAVLLKEWHQPGARLDRDSALAFDSTGALIGYQFLTRFAGAEKDAVMSTPFLNPHWPGDRETLLRALYTRMVQAVLAMWTDGTIAAQHPVVFFSSYNYDSQGYREPILTKLGLEPTRWHFMMQHDLSSLTEAPSWPDGVVPQVIAYDDTANYDRFQAAHDEAFQDHWEYHPPSHAQYAHWRDHGRDREHRHLILAWDQTAQEVAGYSFTCIHPSEWNEHGRKEGVVHLLGVRRPWRQRGVGRAALLAAMHYLRDLGMDTAMLGVDAANPTGALRLYEQIGFKPIRRVRTHLGTVDTMARALGLNHLPPSPTNNS